MKREHLENLAITSGIVILVIGVVVGGRSSHPPPPVREPIIYKDPNPLEVKDFLEFRNLSSSVLPMVQEIPIPPRTWAVAGPPVPIRR